MNDNEKQINRLTNMVEILAKEVQHLHKRVDDLEGRLNSGKYIMYAFLTGAAITMIASVFFDGCN